MPVILALERVRQGDQEFKGSLVCTLCLKPAWGYVKESLSPCLKSLFPAEVLALTFLHNAAFLFCIARTSAVI